jgi:nucleoside-diphosphate-sugar epimerase
VTGGTGFLGSHLVRHLLGEDDEVALLIRPGSDRWRVADIANNVAIIVGDIEAPADISEQLRAWAPDVVYHLAWEGIHGNGRTSTVLARHNICAALDLLEVCAAAGCHTWIGLGSQAEFGPTREVLCEDTPARPVTPYGASKLAVGQLTGDRCGEIGMKHAWLRLLSAYGPMDEPICLIPYIIRELLANRRPALSEGSQQLDTLHARDVASALRRAAVSPSGGTFVLCGGTPLTVRDIAITIRDIAVPEAALGFGERGMVTTGLSGSPAALHAATGWRAAVDLNDGLRETVAWHRDRYPVGIMAMPSSRTGT